MAYNWIEWLGWLSLGWLGMTFIKYLFRKHKELQSWVVDVNDTIKKSKILVRRVNPGKDTWVCSFDGKMSETLDASIEKIEKRLDALETKPKKESK